MANNRTLSMLGLAQRAGKVASGEFAVEKAVKSGHACLVIIAEDASDNTRKMFQNMCTYYKVDLVEYSDKETLGQAIGKEMRVSLALMDENFARAVMKQLNIEKVR